jgi:hypothetical protein
MKTYTRLVGTAVRVCTSVSRARSSRTSHSTLSRAWGRRRWWGILVSFPCSTHAVRRTRQICARNSLEQSAFCGVCVCVCVCFVVWGGEEQGARREERGETRGGGKKEEEGKEEGAACSRVAVQWYSFDTFFSHSSLLTPPLHRVHTLGRVGRYTNARICKCRSVDMMLWDAGAIR